MNDIHGECDPRFDAVRTIFGEHFASGEEVGASLCVWHRGRPVIDLWGGWADREARRPWERDTVGIMFSSTKGLAALCALLLTDRGQLDVDAPVAKYWPGFARDGKGEITVRTLLNHRAALVGLDEPVGIDDFEQRPEKVVDAMERQRPLWAPDTRQGYHAVTFGTYVGELVRRVCGRSIGRFLAEEIAGPLEADVHIGLAPEHEPRVARLYPPKPTTVLWNVLPQAITGSTLEGRVFRRSLDRRSPSARALANPADLGALRIGTFDTPRVRRLELAWANGIGNARGLARVYAALIGADGSGGDRLVRRRTWEALTQRQSWQEPDDVVLKPQGWSQGFLKDQTHLFSPNSQSFGHPGAGGALGWADPVAELAIGYVMNAMDHRIRSRRALALCHAIYRCV